MFERTYQIPYYGLSPRSRMKTGVLLQFFQETADLHARAVNISVDDLRRENATWVLRRYLVDILRLPGREDLTVCTWYEPRGNLRSIREFAAYDANGSCVAKAWSSWIVLNLQSGRPTRLDRVMTAEYYDGADTVSQGPDGDIPLSDGADERVFGVRREELDVNGHANHTAYIGWALESIPDDVAATHMVRRIDAEYLYSAMREDVVVRTRCMSDGTVAFAHGVTLAHSGKEAARLVTMWAPFGEDAPAL